ncbi:hypothetical protein D6817_01515 [Candidatus Pacearchaeota archaeon]|nr:MAG: hypothetical protein D6817_01515 [Candidatus Pacearchaeota archaeon]
MLAVGSPLGLFKLSFLKLVSHRDVFARDESLMLRAQKSSQLQSAPNRAERIRPQKSSRFLAPRAKDTLRIAPLTTL